MILRFWLTENSTVFQQRVKHGGEELHGQVCAAKQMEKVGTLIPLRQALQKVGEFKENY